jgi:hypothetical protein
MLAGAALLGYFVYQQYTSPAPAPAPSPAPLVPAGTITTSGPAPASQLLIAKPNPSSPIFLGPPLPMDPVLLPPIYPQPVGLPFTVFNVADPVVPQPLQSPGVAPVYDYSIDRSVPESGARERMFV